MYSRQILILIVSICVVNAESNDQYRLVNTTNGQVQGVRNTTLLNGIPFYSFKGIPYAKPPINDLRFKVRGSSSDAFARDMLHVSNKFKIRLLNQLSLGVQLFSMHSNTGIFVHNL